MQLTGPPRINDYVCPYPVKDEPLDGRWTDEREDQGRVIRDLDGKRKYIGPRQWRGRWTVTWDAISYRTAQRILYEVGAAQRKGQGVGGGQIGADGFVQPGDFLWTPRTSLGEQGELIDVDGDGIVDVIFREVKIPCILLQQPSTTPLYRRDGGTRIVRMQLEFESTQTYRHRPGFGFPEVIALDWTADAGDQISIDLTDSDENILRLASGEGEIVQDPSATFTAETAGTYTGKMVALSFRGITKTVYKGPIHADTLDQTKMQDLVRTEVGREASSGAEPVTATLSSSFYGPAQEELVLQNGSGNITPDAGALPGTMVVWDVQSGAPIAGSLTSAIQQNPLEVITFSIDSTNRQVVDVDGGVRKLITFVSDKWYLDANSISSSHSLEELQAVQLGDDISDISASTSGARSFQNLMNAPIRVIGSAGSVVTKLGDLNSTLESATIIVGRRAGEPDEEPSDGVVTDFSIVASTLQDLTIIVNNFTGGTASVDGVRGVEGPSFQTASSTNGRGMKDMVDAAWQERANLRGDLELEFTAGLLSDNNTSSSSEEPSIFYDRASYEQLLGLGVGTTTEEDGLVDYITRMEEYGIYRASGTTLQEADSTAQAVTLDLSNQNLGFSRSQFLTDAKIRDDVFYVGDEFRIKGSGSVDGVYEVASASLSGSILTVTVDDTVNAIPQDDTALGGTLYAHYPHA